MIDTEVPEFFPLEDGSNFWTIESDIKHQWDHPVRRKNLKRKIAISILATGFMVVNAHADFMYPGEGTDCLYDWGFKITRHMNYWYRDHTTTRDVIVALSSFLMDVTFLTFCTYFVTKCRTLRPLACIILVYAIRSLFQTIFQMRLPPHRQWEYPGVPSLVVPYDETYNFFYSGHIGCTSLMALEYRLTKYYKLSYMMIFVIVFEVYVLTTMECHYGIDIISAMLFSTYYMLHVPKFVGFLDRIVFVQPGELEPEGRKDKMEEDDYEPGDDDQHDQDESEELLHRDSRS